MDGAGIQRVLAAADAQEAGGLLEGLGSQPGHFADGFAVGEGAVLVAVSHDLLGQFGADAGDVAQQRRRGGVHIHAHAVDHVLHHAGQGVRSERVLVDIVLVHAHADGAWVDLDQLGQRILHAAGDGDRAADGDIQVGHFGARQRAGGIDGGAGLVGDQVVARRRSSRVSSAASCSVSREAVPLPMEIRVTWCFSISALQFFLRFVPLVLRLVRIDGAGIQQLAGGSDHRQLGAGAEAGVEPEHGLPGQRRLPEQGAQVGGKDLDGMGLGRLGQFAAHIALDGGQQQALGGIDDGQLQLLAEGRAQVGAEVIHDGALPVLLLQRSLSRAAPSRSRRG